MSTKRTHFHELLHAQIRNEFSAAQQYIAVATYYDNEDLPQLAKHFYAQANEERNHAMMITQYFLDRDMPVFTPGIDEPENNFADFRAPIKLALTQEQRVTDQIIDLVKAAREEGDFIGEQFMQWFLKEQREEVSIMRTLQTVAQRCEGNLFDLENFIAREIGSATTADATAPAVAGGSL